MSSEDSGGFDDLIEACEIFKKYNNPRCPFHCEHDKLSVSVDPTEVSEEDTKRLDELGFFSPETGCWEDGGFISYRFGSC